MSIAPDRAHWLDGLTLDDGAQISELIEDLNRAAS